MNLRFEPIVSIAWVLSWHKKINIVANCFFCLTSLSSNWVKPCNSFGMGEGIIEFSVENFFWNILVTQTTRTSVTDSIFGLCFQRPSFMAHTALINLKFYWFMKLFHIFSRWFLLMKFFTACCFIVKIILIVWNLDVRGLLNNIIILFICVKTATFSWWVL